MVLIFSNLWPSASGVFESASARNIGMTLGVALAILALLLGASANRIAEGNWIRAVNNVGTSAMTDQVTELAAVVAKAEKTNVITTIILGLAHICVVLSRIVA